MVLEVGGVTPLLLMYDAVDTPLEHKKKKYKHVLSVEPLKTKVTSASTETRL